MMMKYNNLKTFLWEHRKSKFEKREGIKQVITNTRIPSEGGKGQGSFIIDDEDANEFWHHYYNHVFVENNTEHLTEKQLEVDSPILVDFDFRYAVEVTQRQHTPEHIDDVVQLYLSIINEMFIIERGQPFPIYVFEKPDVNVVKDCVKPLTKDGIHMVIGLKMNHTMQLMLREKVMDRIGEVWELPLTNTWDSVFDKGISAGTTNWQIYGSQKPNNQRYSITRYYIAQLKEGEDAVTFDVQENGYLINSPTDLYKVSARYPHNIGFEINPAFVEEYTAYQKSMGVGKVKLLKKRAKKGTIMQENPWLSISSKQQLEEAVNEIMLSLKLEEYVIKETHEYTQILPEDYYMPGSHVENRKVAFALKNTDERLFLSWVMLRSKADDFTYAQIPALYEEWQKFAYREECLTHRSIMYWAKKTSGEEFERIRQNTIDHFIEESISTPTDYDFAMVLYQLYKEKYVCTNIKNRTWYRFSNHRWEKDNGNSLRLNISRQMYSLYIIKRNNLRDQMCNCDPSSEIYEKLKKKLNSVNELVQKLKKTADKSNIFKEACEIFYDDKFNKRMDENRYLMCFTNGVVDIKNKCFRDGLPEDYITKCTNVPYICPSDIDDHFKEEIITFMEQLFPVKSLNLYMWQHLASVLIGQNINQTFNIYRGDGSNGKSKLTDLMTLALGEYVGVVPVNLITDKRTAIGNATSEIMQLKSVRYAIMQEPSKNTKMNEGVMKQLTGDSYMTARALYCESEKFSIQFNLVVCLNERFVIDSNDHGTWRRIRNVEFMSKFVNPDDEEYADGLPEYHFAKDIRLEEKLPLWAPIFASMLVEMVFSTQGHVDDCEIVMQETEKYKRTQDHISSFVSEMIVVEAGASIEKKELTEAFKLWFITNEGITKKIPKGVELFDYVTKKYGVSKNNRWSGIKLVVYYDDETPTEN